MRKLTSFTFFKDTPLTNFQNTILFGSKAERDTFFLKGNHYKKIEFNNPFNFVRDRSTIDLPLAYDELKGVNYCTFLSEIEPSTRYYAYVDAIEYINPKVTRVFLLVDPVMTYCQGGELNKHYNLKVERQHLSLDQYDKELWGLRNNNDVLKTHTKSYFYEKSIIFDDFYVLIQTSVDLQSDFGDVNDPVLVTSEGLTFDNISSPVNLYVVEQMFFRDMMKGLSPYPWITQNFKSINLIPKKFMERSQLEQIDINKTGFKNLYKLKNNGKSNVNNLTIFNFTPTELFELFDLDKNNEKHLLRNEYSTTELYTFNGQSLYIDNGQLNQDIGLEIVGKSVLGYSNEVVFYPKFYRINKHNSKTQLTDVSGGFLNDSISLNKFDEIPILIDSYNLAMSKNANQRALAESKLISNRIGNILNPQSDLKSKFYDSASMLSNVSVMGIGNKFVDEYEYYRSLQAEQKDLALEGGSITNQSLDNSIGIANNFYGITLKFSKPDVIEIEQIKKYYKSFGFYTPKENTHLGNIRTMTIANYVKFNGDWNIEGVDPVLMTQLKIIMESGVRLWHNNNTSNPFIQDLINNEMVV